MNDVKKATLMRILSAVVALPIYVFAIVTSVWNNIPILFCSLLISLITLLEFYRITEKGEEGKPFVIPGMIAAAAVNVVMYLIAFGAPYQVSFRSLNTSAGTVVAVIVLLVASILVLQIFRRPIKGGAYSLGTTVFGVIYAAVFFSHIILMRAMQNGEYYIIILNAAVMLCDSGAYFGGVFFGKHKANIAVSPNKTWEGYFSGLLFCVLAMITCNQVFISFFGVTLFSMLEAGLLGIAICFLTAAGDLSESAIKRDGAIKDSGSIIPGHGGMWDTFDAVLFCLPFFYYYLLIRASF